MNRLAANLLLFASLWITADTVAAATAQQRTDDVRLIRAAFIFNFAKFTDWPDTAFDQSDSNLTLCTAGNDELVEALQLLGDRRIKGHPVVIRPVEEPEGSEACHLLYIAATEESDSLDYIAAVRGKSVLTVSELTGFAESGGMIRLFREDDKIRFAINLEAARSGGLELSSRLLRLAVVVNQESGK